MYNYDVGTQNILPKYSSIIILGVDGSFLHFEHKMNNSIRKWNYHTNTSINDITCKKSEYQNGKDKSNTAFSNYNTFDPLNKVHIS